MLELIIVLIMCHMMGDYWMQGDFIAKTKGQNWYHLFVHCVLYVVPFYMFLGATWHLAVVFLSHLIVDPLKSRYSKITYVQDQILHYIVLLAYLI